MTSHRPPAHESHRLEDARLAEELNNLLAQPQALQGACFLEASNLDLIGQATLAGRVEGSYALERLLGQGGLGAVWLARRSDGGFEE